MVLLARKLKNKRLKREKKEELNVKRKKEQNRRREGKLNKRQSVVITRMMTNKTNMQNSGISYTNFLEYIKLEMVIMKKPLNGDCYLSLLV